MDASTARAAHEFRPDIEGLRGVAVLLVILFHANLVGVSGGFVGVDVFFVISGFLITGLLLRERERTGRIGFRAFYARRVRRLLPAGMVALAATLVAAWIALAPLDRDEAMLDGVAAALSVGNLRFALAAGDYFASVASPSPFLHFWSLSVEEQFYLAWPAVLFLATRVRRPRLGAGIALASIALGSLAVNVWLTDAAVNWAFYSLPSRAWQLALGGLLAIAGDSVARLPGRVLLAAGWTGLLALVGVSLVMDGTIAYPGLPALVPTLAAAALVASGPVPAGPGVLLRTAPLRFLGRISYSLYLWHWPVLVVSAAYLATEPPVEARIGLVGLAVILAMLSWRCIEEPFRTGFPSLAQRQGRTILAGALAVVLVVVEASGLAMADTGTGIAGLPTTGGRGLPSADLDVVEVAGGSDPADAEPGMEAPIVADAADIADRIDLGDEGVIVVDTGTGADPAASPGALAPPSPSDAPSPSAAPTTTVVPSASPGPPVSWRLPRDVRPSLENVRADEERLREDGCLAYEPAVLPPDCVYGDVKGSFTVALVGDSHAAQWFPALQHIATVHGWRLRTYVKVACPFVDMPIFNVALKREYRECEAWRTAVVRELRDVRPDLTIVSGSRYAIHPLKAEDQGVDAQGAALARMLAQVPGRVAVIVDTPEPGEDVPSCLSRHTDDIRKCAIGKATATANRLGVIERKATRATGAALIDLTRRVCPTWPCQVVGNGIIKFRDIRHLTATFARSMAGGLDRALAIVLAPSVVPSPAPSVPPPPSVSPSPSAESSPDSSAADLPSPSTPARVPDPAGP